MGFSVCLKTLRCLALKKFVISISAYLNHARTKNLVFLLASLAIVHVSFITIIAKLLRLVLHRESGLYITKSN